MFNFFGLNPPQLLSSGISAVGKIIDLWTNGQGFESNHRLQWEKFAERDEKIKYQINN